MIISQLTGGLGNQMFQYAAGIALAKSIPSEHYFTFASFESDTPRTFELDVFEIKSAEATFAQLRELRIPQNKFERILDQFVSHFYNNRAIVVEPHYHYSHLLEIPGGNIFLKGYWQSPKYFEKYEKQIRKEFTFKSELNGENKRLLEKYRNHTKVSIHIRRGDYITNKAASDFHGQCDIPYYQKGVRLITKTVKNPVIFAFSDDPEWVKDNLKISCETMYIDWNTDKNSYKDMQLMSNCNHHIIANSSFSWWGAWLNNSNDKIVIAPKLWFADKSINTNDLIPQSWQRI